MSRKSNDDAIKIYQYVISELSRIIGSPVKEVPGLSHVLELPIPNSWYLYVRTSTAAFWALSPKKAEQVERRYRNRWSALLVDGRVRAYLNDDDSEYERIVLLGIHNIVSQLYHMLSPSWTFLTGEYRINEGAKDLENIPSFSSLEQMVSRLGQNGRESHE